MPLKHINAELAKRGCTAHVERSGDNYHFVGGEATGWHVISVKARTANTLTLEQWLEEFERLRKLNAEIVRAGARTGKL